MQGSYQIAIQDQENAGLPERGTCPVTAPATSPAWQPPVYIVTGGQGEGKTTFVQKVIDGLIENGVKCRGIVTPGYYRDDVRAGFSVIDLATGISQPLCSDTPSAGGEQHGRFYFLPEGLGLGYSALAAPRVPGTADILVIDEVGRFELKGAVWAGCLDRIVALPYPPMIWTVRSDKVDEVKKRWPVARQVVVGIGSATHGDVVRELVNEVRMYRSVSCE
jgi:nucleoside-triphosphatase